MPRKKPSRTGNRQHSKNKKRPRGWHRRARKSAWKIWREIKGDHRPEDAPP